VIGRRQLLAAGAALAAAPAFGAEPALTVRRLSPALDRIVAPGTRAQVIATGITWAEGPVWTGDALLFSDVPANTMMRWTRATGARPFLRPSGVAQFDPKLIREAGSNGLAMDAQGRLLIANSGGRSIDRLDLHTRRREVLVDRFADKRFNSCNDIAVASDGAIYFTDPPYGLAGGDESPVKELPHNGVYRWREGGAAELVDATLPRPNGVALSPDGRRLYVSVSDEAMPAIYRYDLDAAGKATGRQLFLDARPLRTGGAPGLPDGLKVARDGTVFATAPGGLRVMTPAGETLGVLDPGPRPCANCAVGEGGRALFLTADDRVLRLPLANGFRA
jgi:gluconolactonase